jgi:hypothetical protein
MEHHEIMETFELWGGQQRRWELVGDGERGARFS